jgi:hypothetical protein
MVPSGITTDEFKTVVNHDYARPHVFWSTRTPSVANRFCA